MEKKNPSEPVIPAEDDELLSQICACHTDAVLVIEPGTCRIVCANSAACELYGFTSEALKGINISAIDQSPSAWCSELLHDRRRTQILTHRLASGETGNVEVHSMPFILKGRTFLFCLVYDAARQMQQNGDFQRYSSRLEMLVKERTELLEKANAMLTAEIAERKAAEEALNDSEGFLKSIVENIPDMIFVKEAKELRFVRFNRAGEELLGYDRTELQGKNDHDFFPSDEADFFNRKDREVLSGGTLIDIPEEPLETRCRGVRILHTKKIPILDDDGNPKYLLGISEDITERRKAEEQLRASLKEKETLLKEMYHRVKNNMQLISSLLHLQSRASADLNLKEALTTAQGRIKSMALVHEKLYHSQSLTRIDFGEYLNDMMKLLSRSYVKRNIRCIVEVEKISFSIETAIPLGIIVNELITNSMKYAFPDDREGELLLKIARESDGAVCMTIRDYGVGIPGSLDFRSPSTLGLQLVNDLVCQIGGDIELDRSAGTAFTVRFMPPAD